LRAPFFAAAERELDFLAPLFLAPPFAVLLFLVPLFFALVRFRGTFAPSSRASLSPIAIACSRLFTFGWRPAPLFSVPRFRSCIARSTLLLAALPYLRPDDFRLDAAICHSPRTGD
jgi:hypothetical protein